MVVASVSPGIVWILVGFQVLVAALVALKAKEKGRQPGLWFVFALVLFVPAVIAVWSVKPRKGCVSCGEMIPKAAKVCSRCGARQTQESPA